MNKWVLCAICLLSVASLSFADLLLDESFNYADGSLTNVSNGAWVKTSGSDDPSTPIVTDGAITVSRSDADDVSREFSATTYTNGSLFYKFDLTVTDAASSLASGYYFAGLGQATTTLRDRLYATTDSTSSGDFQLGCGNDTLGVRWGSDLLLNTLYTVVVQSDLDTDTTRLWIDPTTAESTSVAFQDDNTYSVNGMIFRQASGIGINTIDNLKVGTTFSDVVAVPEPASIAIIGLGASAFGGRSPAHEKLIHDSNYLRSQLGS